MSPQTRKYERHNHIYLRIKVKVQQQWEWIRIFSWNEIGFNFIFDSAIEKEEVLLFKKGVTTFTGEIVWRREHVDEQILYEMAINQILFDVPNREHDPVRKEKLRQEIELLVRQTEQFEQKVRYLLNDWGIKAHKEELDKIIDKHKWRTAHHFGIKVDDETWAAISQDAYMQSKPLQEFEQYYQNILKAL